jgi:hypothetical protein
MVYNLISGRIIIQEVYDFFNPQSHDWVARCPRWIYKGLREINSNAFLVSAEPMEVEIHNYKFELPDDLANLRGIVINHIKQDRITTVSGTKAINHNLEHELFSDYYTLHGDYVTCEKEHGVAKIYYEKYPNYYDKDLQQMCPIIRNNENLISALKWYIMIRMQSRGYVHGVYQLGARNQRYDPSILWMEERKIAKMSINRLDNEGRRMLADLMTTFLVNPYQDSEEFFYKRDMPSISPFTTELNSTDFNVGM